MGEAAPPGGDDRPAPFVSLVALDVALSPGTAANGWIIKVVILVALIKAVQAGIKHRELRRIAEASAAGSP
ncbi:MAG: hypothetical protein R3B68_14250 [Phycisphaerales bacterium]